MTLTYIAFYCILLHYIAKRQVVSKGHGNRASKGICYMVHVAL